MARISASEKPLAMRSITVPGFCPERNASMAATISAGSRPTSRGTRASPLALVGWQPEHEGAPDGGVGAAAAAGGKKNEGGMGSATAIPPPPSAASGGGGGGGGRAGGGGVFCCGGG